MKKPQRKSVVIRDYQKLASLIEGGGKTVGFDGGSVLILLPQARFARQLPHRGSREYCPQTTRGDT